MGPKANDGLCMAMMCQCNFIHCNICTTLVKDVDNEESYACMGTGGMWNTSLPSCQFSHELRAALKNLLKYKLKKLDKNNFYFLFCYAELECFPYNYTDISKA